MFIDELTIYARAGKGGDGVVRWRREKFISRGGPAGGDGGKGGDVYVEAIRDINILFSYRFKKIFKAQNGENGRSKKQHGRNGEDLFIKLPIGSVIKNLKTDKTYELIREGEQILLLQGGKGGYGNEYFKSSTNTTPEEWTPGKIGEEADFYIELQLIADIGLMGLPNAGKSTLLNALTSAHAKIGAYPFTTIEPNLGVMIGDYIIADIPGLIEGASHGKGLGIKFLRHIKRTKILVHLVSFENADKMMKVYRTIRDELEMYDKDLVERDEIIVLTKTDLIQDDPSTKLSASDLIARKMKEFKKLKKPVFTISAYDNESLKNLQDELTKLLRKKKE